MIYLLNVIRCENVHTGLDRPGPAESLIRPRLGDSGTSHNMTRTATGARTFTTMCVHGNSCD